MAHSEAKMVPDGGQWVEFGETAKPLFTGSNPVVASTVYSPESLPG